MKGKIFQAFLILILAVIVAGFTGCKTQGEIPLPEPSLPPEFFLDSDADGFNDWFETNIAYNASIPNERFIILYVRYDDPVNFPNAGDKTDDSAYQFFTEKGRVPPENIIRLYEEEASSDSLRDAIGQVAKKSDENDIVFLSLSGHGGGGGITGDVEYIKVDEWLDEVTAKVVIVKIWACGCEESIPVLKDGPCPRILFVYTAGEFIGALGQNPNYTAKIDVEYGNNDGYASLAEIGEWLNNEPKGWKDNEYGEGEPGDGYWNGQSWLEKMGFSLMSDTSGIADQIYLTDYCNITLATSNS